MLALPFLGVVILAQDFATILCGNQEKIVIERHFDFSL